MNPGKLYNQTDLKVEARDNDRSKRPYDQKQSATNTHQVYFPQKPHSLVLTSTNGYKVACFWAAKYRSTSKCSLYLPSVKLFLSKNLANLPSGLVIPSFIYVHFPSISLYKLTCKLDTGTPFDVSKTWVDIGGFSLGICTICWWNC